GLDHVPKFVKRTERVLTRAVRLVRRKKRDGGVAPVVDFPSRCIPGVELKDRQQLYGGGCPFLQGREFFVEGRVPAAELLPDSGTRMAGEAAHVHFINDGAG